MFYPNFLITSAPADPNALELVQQVQNGGARIPSANASQAIM